MSDTTDNNDTTDTNTDEPSKAELHERVNRLESLIERMLPSRRGVIGAIAAVLGGTYLGSQTVESSTGSAGQLPALRQTMISYWSKNNESTNTRRFR